MELTAQIYIREQEWDKAEEILKEAELVLKDQNKYAMFAHKWRAVAESMKSGRVNPVLLECRTEAAKSQDWETVRDCDFFIGVIRKNTALLHKLYFGTPHTHFRERVIEALKEANLPLPDHYLWTPSGGTSIPGPAFDLTAGSMGESCLESGRLMHRMMALLCRDFYRPVTMGAAFSALFDGEHFSQIGSTNRVHQVVLRLRDWLAANDTGLTITGGDGKYQLSGSRAILVPRALPEPSGKALSWFKVESQITGLEFTRNDLVEATQVSPATAKRLVRYALDAGHIRAIGGGANLRYRILARAA